MPAVKPVKFKAVLTVATPESGWHYIPVAWKVGEKFPKNGGTRRVICTINGAESFPCALMPYDGEFTIVVNKERRKKLGIGAGDKITVEIAPDESEHGMPMPDELQEVLAQDPDGQAAFAALTPGKRRSMMFHIGKIKDIDLRIHTALIFIDHIKRNNGKIIYEQLTAELKRPQF
jgi:bifunctional DNA-binding transcriptional regulator/antitoxin component of YhaV-PrlF toxin-antitoxin module